MSFWNRFGKVVIRQVNHWVDDLEQWIEKEETKLDEKEAKKRASFEEFSRRSHSKTTSTKDPILVKYYANLEVPYGSPYEVVRISYRKLVKQYHPDLHEVDEQKRQVAEQILKKLNEAFQYLEEHLKT